MMTMLDVVGGHLDMNKNIRQNTGKNNYSGAFTN